MMPDLFTLAALVSLLAYPFALRLGAVALGCCGLAGLAAFLPHGVPAAVVASATLVFASYNLVQGIRCFIQAPGHRSPEVWAMAMSTTGPVVAAVAWVWSRYNGSFAGFPDPLATLTVAHFSVTFGLLPAALAAWHRRLPPSRLRDMGVWGLVCLPPLVGLLFSLRTELLRPSLLEVLGTGLMALSFMLWWLGTPSIKLRLLGLPLLSGFVLGAGYAASAHFGWAWLDYRGMLGWHGLGNLLACVFMLRGLTEE